MDEDKRHTIVYEDGTATLTINPAEANDFGEYMCTAKNKLGSVDTEASLIVHCKLTNTFILIHCLVLTSLSIFIPKIVLES